MRGNAYIPDRASVDAEARRTGWAMSSDCKTRAVFAIGLALTAMIAWIAFSGRPALSSAPNGTLANSSRWRPARASRLGQFRLAHGLLGSRRSHLSPRPGSALAGTARGERSPSSSSSVFQHCFTAPGRTRCVGKTAGCALASVLLNTAIGSSSRRGLFVATSGQERTSLLLRA
jgi:hypothetical protein